MVFLLCPLLSFHKARGFCQGSKPVSVRRPSCFGEAEVSFGEEARGKVSRYRAICMQNIDSVAFADSPSFLVDMRDKRTMASALLRFNSLASVDIVKKSYLEMHVLDEDDAMAGLHRGSKSRSPPSSSQSVSPPPPVCSPTLSKSSSSSRVRAMTHAPALQTTSSPKRNNSFIFSSKKSEASVDIPVKKTGGAQYIDGKKSRSTEKSITDVIQNRMHDDGKHVDLPSSIEGIGHRSPRPSDNLPHTLDTFSTTSQTSSSCSIDATAPDVSSPLSSPGKGSRTRDRVPVHDELPPLSVSERTSVHGYEELGAQNGDSDSESNSSSFMHENNLTVSGAASQTATSLLTSAYLPPSPVSSISSSTSRLHQSPKKLKEEAEYQSRASTTSPDSRRHFNDTMSSPMPAIMHASTYMPMENRFPASFDLRRTVSLHSPKNSSGSVFSSAPPDFQAPDLFCRSLIPSHIPVLVTQSQSIIHTQGNRGSGDGPDLLSFSSNDYPTIHPTEIYAKGETFHDLSRAFSFSPSSVSNRNAYEFSTGDNCCASLSLPSRHHLDEHENHGQTCIDNSSLCKRDSEIVSAEVYVDPPFHQRLLSAAVIDSNRPLCYQSFPNLDGNEMSAGTQRIVAPIRRLPSFQTPTLPAVGTFINSSHSSSPLFESALSGVTSLFGSLSDRCNPVEKEGLPSTCTGPPRACIPLSVNLTDEPDPSGGKGIPELSTPTAPLSFGSASSTRMPSPISDSAPLAIEDRTENTMNLSGMHSQCAGYDVDQQQQQEQQQHGLIGSSGQGVGLQILVDEKIVKVEKEESSPEATKEEERCRKKSDDDVEKEKEGSNHNIHNEHEELNREREDTVVKYKKEEEDWVEDWGGDESEKEQSSGEDDDDDDDEGEGNTPGNVDHQSMNASYVDTRGNPYPTTSPKPISRGNDYHLLSPFGAQALATSCIAEAGTPMCSLSESLAVSLLSSRLLRKPNGPCDLNGSHPSSTSSTLDAVNNNKDAYGQQTDNRGYAETFTTTTIQEQDMPFEHQQRGNVWDAPPSNPQRCMYDSIPLVKPRVHRSICNDNCQGEMCVEGYFQVCSHICMYMSD